MYADWIRSRSALLSLFRAVRQKMPHLKRTLREGFLSHVSFPLFDLVKLPSHSAKLTRSEVFSYTNPFGISVKSLAHSLLLQRADEVARKRDALRSTTRPEILSSVPFALTIPGSEPFRFIY